MRILHTADWHLGRTLLQVSLLDDQRHAIERLFHPLVREARPDLVVIAGDIYDRAVPSPDAVGLLDDTLTELTLGIGVPVLAISGNHDSEGRIRYASRILARSGLTICGGLEGPAAPVLSIAAMPLTVGGTIIGCVELVNRCVAAEDEGTGAYTPEDLKLMDLAASEIGVAVSRSMRARRREMQGRLSAIGHMLSGVVHDLRTPEGLNVEPRMPVGSIRIYDSTFYGEN